MQPLFGQINIPLLGNGGTRKARWGLAEIPLSQLFSVNKSRREGCSINGYQLATV
jgi:hypothetical protein